MTLASRDRLTTIPAAEIAPGGQVRHAIDDRARAQALRDGCLAWLPARRARCSRCWMRSRAVGSSAPPHPMWRRSAPSRRHSITPASGSSTAATNGDARRWRGRRTGCRGSPAPSTGRFPGLGRYAEIARMHGPAGAFDTVTWPGFVGALTACAPGRFAACINQAPLRRRTRHPWLRPYDIARMRWRPGGSASSRPTICCARCSRPATALAGAPAPRGDAGRPPGDLYAGRLPARRALRDRANRAGLREPRGRYRRGQ